MVHGLMMRQKLATGGGLCGCLVSWLIGTSVALSQTPTFDESDWPWWRGPERQGHASAQQTPPLHWSDPSEGEPQNIVWKQAIPGRGHGSVIALNDRIYVQVADTDRDSLLLLCLDRATGDQVWEAVVHQGDFESVIDRQPNTKSSWASCTPATDGERIFVNFYFDKAVYTSAVGLEGDLLWQQRLCPYEIHQGYGSSPTVYQNLVIASADNKQGGQVVAMKRSTGRVVWRHDRPKEPNYASPVVLQVDGKDQLLLTGCNLVTSLNPLTGKLFWEIDGATTECVTSTVTDGTHLYSSGGYPRNHVAAIVGDGSGTIAWNVNTRVYVPSMLLEDGHLYMTLDAGIAMCMDCQTGETKWKARLGGDYTASPVLVNGLIYAVNEEGKCTVFRANPEAFELVAENHLGDSVMSTPVICGGQIYFRVGKRQDGKRQEFIYCVGE